MGLGNRSECTSVDRMRDMHLQFNINSIFEYQLNSVGIFCRANPRWISVHKLCFNVHGALALPTGRKGHTC